MTATFTEQWFDTPSQEVLAHLVDQVASVAGLVVEIGAWEGRSTIALANAANPREVHTVDTWAGSPGEISADLAAERDVYVTWRSNVDSSTSGNVVEHRMGWREYLPTVDEPIALAFIDAEHSYVEVRDNIAELLPKMAPGGIICGDDVHHPPVQQAVCELLDPHSVAVEAALWIYRVPTPIEAMHAENCAAPSDINEHLPRLATMAEKASHVVELGARSGLSTTAWLVGLAKSGGRLTSVDISPAPQIGTHTNWEHIQGDDTDADVLAQVEGCDILFIDTSHAYEHTLWELRNWSPKVRNGGIIVCHDTELQRPWDPPCPVTDPDFPVATAINEFCAERGYRWVNIPGCWGLGIIEVVEAT